MAMNPMQRKANNSFLLGILITLLITGLIIAFLIFQLSNLNKQMQEEEAKLKQVYVLNTDIMSGQVITSDMLEMKTIDGSAIPANAITPVDVDNKGTVVDESTGNVIRKLDVVTKIDLKSGTILTSEMIATADELSSDLRRLEYNVVQFPSQLQTGDFIDIRLRLPSGEDYIVVSHKEVEIPVVDGIDSENTMIIKMNEVETLTMSSAIIEAYIAEGSYLYATRYVDAGMQEAATPTYLPSDSVINLMNKDPNCANEAKQELFKRNNDSSYKSAVRNPINDELNQNSEDAQDNIISSVEEELKAAQEERQKYLESLGAY